MKPHIICFHLFNDYSGSPKVLTMVLNALLTKGYQIDLESTKGGQLDEMSIFTNINKIKKKYNYSHNTIHEILRYCAVQLYTFLLSFRWLFHKNIVFYINTLLPLGPALAGRIMGKHVVYHYHENAFVKGFFYKILAKFMQILAHEIICVSNHQASFLKQKRKVFVIPNALTKKFKDRLVQNPEDAFMRKSVLMLGSLKQYKSPLEFIEIANEMKQYSFVLVVNDTQENINSFINEHHITLCNNITIYPRQNDVVPFYNKASLVLNLSNKQMDVETFGLTILEAMSCSLPVIVPTEGGVAEMVEDGMNGYKIDVQELNKIKETINLILSDKDLYLNLAENATASAEHFVENEMIDGIESIIIS